MATKRPSLGRGLEALLGTNTPAPGDDAAPPAAGPRRDEELAKIPVDLLQRGRYQPRLDMRPESLQELADSIRAQGVVQPIIVRPIVGQPVGEPDRYEIIAGERRWRAARAAGLAEIPVVVTDVDEGASFEISLIENLQRADLDPIEEAEALHKLVESSGLSHEDVASRIGRDRVTVTNSIRLLKLPPEVRALLAGGELSTGHGRALLGLDSEQQQLKLAHEVVAEALSVRELERRVQGHRRTRPKAVAKGRSSSPDIRAAERELEQSLTLRVRITPARRGSGGKVEIVYASLEDFDRIREKLVGIAE